MALIPRSDFRGMGGRYYDWRGFPAAPDTPSPSVDSQGGSHTHPSALPHLRESGASRRSGIATAASVNLGFADPVSEVEQKYLSAACMIGALLFLIREWRVLRKISSYGGFRSVSKIPVPQRI